MQEINMTPRQKAHQEMYEKNLASIKLLKSLIANEIVEENKKIYMQSLEKAEKSVKLHLEASISHVYDGVAGYFGNYSDNEKNIKELITLIKQNNINTREELKDLISQKNLKHLEVYLKTIDTEDLGEFVKNFDF